MDALVAGEFFGFDPEQVYTEVHAICYNEFLQAATCLRNTLIQEFPERQEEAERGCSALLEDYSVQFEKEWFAKFHEYCSRNLFLIPRHVPVYGSDLGQKEHATAVEEIEKLRGRVMATEYLNAALRARLAAMDRELAARKKLLREVEEAERKAAVVARAIELEGQLREVVAECDVAEQ